MISYIDYIRGILGCFLFCDGVTSIRLYRNTFDESGKRIKAWKYDYPLRLIQCAIGIFLMIMGAII